MTPEDKEKVKGNPFFEEDGSLIKSQPVRWATPKEDIPEPEPVDIPLKRFFMCLGVCAVFVAIALAIVAVTI